MLHVSPASATETGALAALAGSGLCAAVRGLPAPPYAVLDPYSKVTVVAVPFELTMPFNVAEVAVTALAAVVVTVGESGQAAVVNWRSAPLIVPPMPLFASARK